MPLFIPQGKQDTTQDNKFNPIIANDVMLEITELKLAESQQNTLEVTLRILDGKYKNVFIFDRITFDPTSPMSWKYRQLRKCAGVPYSSNEPVSIDIESLLLHKAVKADLSIRKGKNKDGEEQDYQNIKYKVLNVTQLPKPTVNKISSVFSPASTEPVKSVINEPVTTKVETTQAPVFSADIKDTKVDIAITDEGEWD